VVSGIRFYIGCGVVMVGSLLLTIYINERPYFFSPEMTDPGVISRALDAYASVGNLLTTLDTGLIAGLGLLLTYRPKQRYATRDIWPAAVSALCVGLSLYWGYVCSQNVEWAIESAITTLDVDKIQWPRQLQFFTIVLGVFFFADFVRRDLTRAD